MPLVGSGVVLGEVPDSKTPMRSKARNHDTSSGTEIPKPHLGARPWGEGLVSEPLGGGPLLMRPESGDPVAVPCGDRPPAGGAIDVWCVVEQTAAEGRGLDGSAPGC